MFEQIKNRRTTEKKIAFHTLGCKVNQYETQLLRERFSALGFQMAEEGEIADVYVVNSCTVTGVADRKSRQFVRRAKRQNPKAITALIGCYAQVAKEELAALPEIDILLGSGEKGALPERVLAALETKQLSGGWPSMEGARSKAKPAEASLPRPDVSPATEKLEGERSPACIAAPDELAEADGALWSSGVAGLGDRTRAYIKIEDGCDRYCTYCVIPHARGAVRSRPVDMILAEARRLIEGGYKEILLTGINAALYGADMDENSGCTGRGEGILYIVREISKIPGDYRIRLGSLEPTVIDHRIAARLIENDRLCPHLHLSLQSGSDRILKAMGRHYTAADYCRILDVLRKKDPLFSITTDVIAGFPGETEDDFIESLRLIEDAVFSRVHVFKYSARKGTPAAEMPNQVSEIVKSERARKLAQTGSQATAKFIKNNKNSVRRTLFLEKVVESGYYIGITDNEITVRKESAYPLVNCFLDVVI